jgi:hypothetical protein
MFHFIRCRNNVRLSFENEMIDITCIPNRPDELESDNFDSSPSNGEFSFYFDNEQITFSSSNHRRSTQGGCLYITIKMTPEIKKSLDKAMSDWKKYLEENATEDEDEF